ncbi:TetR/AcrR family transcriptional regulator [Plantactinospora siamensis]|uniref:TetR/AcrR family transcriptional regulator n=1 Tax=Plantactinospora siamensis TaxID=555372 RepID=A0ABV6P3Q5_9ACTN
MSDAATNPGRESIWARPERGARGPAPGHSREAIVAAAVALADSHGLAAVSMRAVATELGTGAGTLYRYLSGRDDLLDLMADRVVGELMPFPAVPDPGVANASPAGGAAAAGWLDRMLALARRQLMLFQAHPWLVELVRRGVSPGPNTLGYLDHCLDILRPVRCSATAKFEAMAMVTGVVSLFARAGASAGSVTFAGLDLAAYPHLVAAFAEPAGPVPRQDLFERTLRGLLSGLLGTGQR